MIATLELKRIGIFDPRYLHPVVGARESGETGVTTPLECELVRLCPTGRSMCECYKHSVYGKDGLDLVFIQQRSPAVKV